MTLSVIAGISLTGCERGFEPSPRFEVFCPPIVSYGETFSNNLADEVQELPSDSVIPEALSDYVELRGAIRVCIEQREQLK